MGSNRFVVLLLAAGSSSRMGQSKQLLTINGKSLLLTAAEAALGTGVERTVVVLGAEEKAHREVLHTLQVELVHNPSWQKGIGNSIKIGLNFALEMIPDLTGVIIMVCDQPLMTSVHLQNLIIKHKEKQSPVVASAYAGTLGVPALFDRSLFPELLSLEDHQGAKKFMPIETTQAVQFPEGAIDLDTMEDYHSFIQQKK